MRIVFILVFCLGNLCAFATILNPSDPAYVWMDRLIEKEFAPFRGGITFKSLETTRHDWVVRLKVINNQVYQINGGQGAGYSLLTYLAQIYGLPDLDILYCQQDVLWDFIHGGAPIFCPTKKKWVTQGLYFTDWGSRWPRTSFDVEAEIINEAITRQSWDDRIDQLVWRGTSSDGSYSPANWMLNRRGILCALSLKAPHLIDARFNSVNPWTCSDVESLRKVLPVGESMSLPEHMAYKYQIILDGCCAPVNGDRWRLFSDSVVFMHESEYGNWFYEALVPGIHYVPVRGDLSDLIEKLEYFRSHDNLAREMAARAREFTKTHLMPEHLALYCYKALLKYASLQKFTPSL